MRRSRRRSVPPICRSMSRPMRSARRTRPRPAPMNTSRRRSIRNAHWTCRTPDAPLRKCTPYVWGSNCATSIRVRSTQLHVEVRLYRQLRLKDGDPFGNRQLKRMMGQNTFQRSALTANHGVHYIDTTVSGEAGGGRREEHQYLRRRTEVRSLLSSTRRKSTKQIYELYVGKDKRKDFGETNVKFGYMNIVTAKYRFGAAKPPGGTVAGALPRAGEPLRPEIRISDLVDRHELACRRLRPEQALPRQADVADSRQEALPAEDDVRVGQTRPTNGKCKCIIDDRATPLRGVPEKNAGTRICELVGQGPRLPGEGLSRSADRVRGLHAGRPSDHLRRRRTTSQSGNQEGLGRGVEPDRDGLSGSRCNYTKVPRRVLRDGGVRRIRRPSATSPDSSSKLNPEPSRRRPAQCRKPRSARSPCRRGHATRAGPAIRRFS